jgi:hypothetical protein
MTAHVLCRRCGNYGWVCADHQDVPWLEGKGCGCGAEGAPCACNPTAEMPPGTLVVAEATPTKNHWGPQ